MADAESKEFWSNATLIPKYGNERNLTNPDIAVEDPNPTFQEMLNSFLDELPKATYDISGRWSVDWRDDQDKYGDESIYTLFPEDMGEKNLNLLSKFISSLNRIGINTRTELPDMPTSEFRAIRGVGDKLESLFRIAKGLIEEQRKIGSGVVRVQQE